MTTAATEKYLTYLLHDAGAAELCHLSGGRVRSTWHTRVSDLMADALAKSHTGNLFTTLNRIDRDKLDAHLASRPGSRTPDACVQRYSRLFFDFDPERPQGQSSTAAELAAAEARARGLTRKLAALGWPPPLMAMSGNGAHLQYRCALPNTAETAAMLKTIYAGLAREFGDDEVAFDTTVKNPARLCGFYGSKKRKGADTAERPHRQSSCTIPEPWAQIHPRQVSGLADFYAAQTPATTTCPPASRASGPRVTGRGDFASLDVVAWFGAHGAYVGKLGGHVHAVRCPWRAEHSTPSPQSGSDTIVFEGDGGWPGFHCKHGHCDGRTIRDVLAIWPDSDAFCAAFFQARRGGDV